MSGRTAIVGRTFPREVALVLEESELGFDNELETDKELTCRASKLGEEVKDSGTEVKDVGVLEVKVGVIVDEGAEFGIEL